MIRSDYSNYLDDFDKFVITEADWLRAPYLHDMQFEHCKKVIRQFNLKTVIEFGIGGGHLARRLRTENVSYLGVDSSALALEFSKRRNPDLNFVRGDIRNFGGEQSHDLCVFFAVAKHFAHSEWATIIKRMMAFGKYVIFTQPIANEVKDDGVEYPHLWVTQMHVESLVAEAGYEILEFNSTENPVEWTFVCRRK